MASTKPGPIPKTGKCPICKAPGDAQYRPFCSRRCSDVDLSRWLRGAYAIPGSGAEADEEADDTAQRREAIADKERDPDEDA